MQGILNAILFATISFLSAAVGVYLSGRLADRWRAKAAGPVGLVFADAPRRYEFREGYLLSTIDQNDAFLPSDADRSSALDALTQSLKSLHREIPERITGLARRGEAFVLPGRIGEDILSIAGRMEVDRLVITVGPSDADAGRHVIDSKVLAAMQAEVEDLRKALDASRTLIWKEDEDGRVLWANTPYFAALELRSSVAADEVTWPVPRLFGDQINPLPDPGTVRRCRLDAQEDAPVAADEGHWFEVSARRNEDGTVVFGASQIDRLVEAETSLRNFVQTLSKTFAQLPTGLAVFDRRRELMLFNPALVTLSRLDAEFLSNRPSLVAFLDALRDRQRMPEPKDYRNWRDEIARLEEGAEKGTYQELWSLPGGQSFRVTGRPHPDGAVAFLFEDISSEVSLTRRFRGELDLYRAALDETSDALALFSDDGRLVFANAAYGALWGQVPEDNVGVLSLIEATRIWQAGTEPTGLWGDIRSFAEGPGERVAWSEEVVTSERLHVCVRVTPLVGGTIAVGFHKSTERVDPAYDRPAVSAALHEVAEAAAPFRSRRAAQD